MRGRGCRAARSARLRARGRGARGPDLRDGGGRARRAAGDGGRRAHRRRRDLRRALRAPRAPRVIPDHRSRPDADPDLLRLDRRRLALPPRHRRAAVPAAADAAGRVRHERAGLGPHHLRQRRGRDDHAGDRDAGDPPLRIPPRAHRQFGDQQPVPGGLWLLPLGDAALADLLARCSPAASSARCNSPASAPSPMPTCRRR